MAESAGLSVRQIEKRYPGADRMALAGVSLEIEPGSFFSILGPSGCGKTTLLRVLAGFERPTSGRVKIGGDDVTSIAPRERDIAMVFQDYALYPHMTVRQNLTFNLHNRRTPLEEIEKRLAETAGMLGIERHLTKYPAQLSGGERQRVALGRALIRKPRVFLMDEPLSNLDLKLREAMRLELGRLHRRLGITVVYVTHDQAEAMTLSTAIAVMNNGEVQQVDHPETVYTSPANSFVAKFIGSPSMNLFRAVHADGILRFVGSTAAIRLPFRTALAQGQAVLVGARPHELTFGDPGAERIRVRVSFTERMGRANIVVCVPEAEDSSLVGSDVIQVETDVGETLAQERAVWIGFRADALKLFDERGISIERGGALDDNALRVRAWNQSS